MLRGRSSRLGPVLAGALLAIPVAIVTPDAGAQPKSDATAKAGATPMVRKVIATGGQRGDAPALEIAVEPVTATIRLRRCKTADCGDAGNATRLPLTMDRNRLDLHRATIEPIAIARGRSIAHVRVPDIERADLAYELLVGGHSDEPIFAGTTGFTRGEDGDRSGTVVSFHDRDADSRFVVVADAREDTRICGQTTTPLAPRGLDPTTMQLRGATLHRIDKKRRDAAEQVVAVAKKQGDVTAPLARVLVATGGSAPLAARLTDGLFDAAWSEQRPGDGHGEFATMQAPGELPIGALVVRITPEALDAAGAAPRTFYVATDARLLRVTMPEDAWLKPGGSYEIPISPAVRTSCVAIVLDEAYARAPAPVVSIAEVHALSSFDLEHASLDDVAKALSSPRGSEAAALLKRAGEPALAAVAARMRDLDAAGRALAVDVASSAGTCDGAAGDLLASALTDAELEVRRRAMGRLERCGRNAGPALARAVSSGDEATKAAAAPLLATVAPSLALQPLAAQMGVGAPETRRAIRGAFARASAGQSRDKLLGLLPRPETSREAKLDLLRGFGAKLPELRPESGAAIAELLRGSPDMATRWLLVQPLAHLARAADATSGELSRLAELMTKDPAWQVRARAVDLAAGIATLAPFIARAATDPSPRVRESALRAAKATGQHDASAREMELAAGRALAGDDWTFVRVAAADALAVLPRDPATRAALGAALEDPSSRVRAAALTAIGKQQATDQAGRVRDRLDDAREEPEVRALAARTLGAMCVQSATDRLTKLASLSQSPVDEADERVGMAAIEALGALRPSDLAERLAPLRAKGVRAPVRAAVERAMTEPSPCR